VAGWERNRDSKRNQVLGVMLDSRVKWDKERKYVLIRGKIALSSINIRLARAQNIQVKV
jgi:hypothetical protein